MMVRRHEIITVSMEKSTLTLLRRLARKRGRGWSMSAYVSNATRDALVRDLDEEEEDHQCLI